MNWTIQQEKDMAVKRVTSIVMIVSAVALAVGTVPGSAAQSQPDNPGSASVAAAHRLGPEMRLSPSPECDADDQELPDVAYNPVHGEYLVVWHNSWSPSGVDIYARRVSRNGEVLDWFSVATGLDPGGDGKDRLMPSVTYNAANDEYLVVWMYEASSSVYEVWGRRIPWDSPTSHSEFLIFAGTNQSLWTPGVAWNSSRNEYMVIWNTFDTSTWKFAAIAGCRVSADGLVQPGAPITITASSQPRQPDLVYSETLDGYMVAWMHTGTTTGYDIYGAFLDPDGAKITPPGEFPIYEGPGDQWSPAVASNEENRYMVVWNHSGDIYGRLLRANGTPVADPLALTSTPDQESMPDVAANATGQYLAVWTRVTSGGESIVARLCNADGTLATPVDVFVAPSIETEDAASAVACAAPGCLIAYSTGSSSSLPAHIYGRLYWPQEIYLPLVLVTPP